MLNNENMQDQKHAQSQTIFHLVPKTNGEVIKIWDFMMPACNPRTGEPNGRYGRVRIMGVFGKSPAPLENIRFSVAWCNPEDVRIFTKKRSNQIMVGRFVKAFADFQEVENVGIVGKIEAIKNFPLAALNSLKYIPMWAAGLPTTWDYLQSKKDFANRPDGKVKFGKVAKQIKFPVKMSASGTMTLASGTTIEV